MAKAEATKKTKATSAKKATGSSKKATGAPQKILDMTRMLEKRLDTKSVPRKMIAASAGVKSGTFPVTLSIMKKQGLISYDKETISLTESGHLRASDDFDSDCLFDNEKVQDDIKKRYKIGGKAALLFDVLTDGSEHDRHAVATGIGCTNKATFAVMLSNLKKHGIIEYDRATVRLTDMCFGMSGRSK